MNSLAHTANGANAADGGFAGAKTVRFPIGSILAAACAVAMIGIICTISVAQLSQPRFAPSVARELQYQSQTLSEAGDRTGAITASRKATEIYRGLMRVSALHYAPQLASSLHDLSVRLGEAGDGAGATAAINEAIEMRRRLAKESARYAASLEQSLQLLARMRTAYRSELPELQTAASAVR